jgi:hypothetical protein
MSYSSPPPSPKPGDKGKPFTWSSLSVYARAGIAIACLIVAIFLISTLILCIVRRGRLFNGTWYYRNRSSRPNSALSASSSAVPRREYAKDNPEKGGLSSSVRELVAEEEEQDAWYSRDVERAGVRRPEEVRLEEYRYQDQRGEVGLERRQAGAAYEQQQHYHQQQQRHEQETEYRPWNVV